MQIGIVGLPYSGKTTLFQTLTNTYSQDSASQKRENNQAIVKVPDERLEKLNDMFHPEKLTFATVEFVDSPSQPIGENDSFQFTSSFLSKIRQNDAIIHVVRGFESDIYPHPKGSIDFYRDIKYLDSEFILSDMAMVETRIEKLQKLVTKSNDESAKKEMTILNRWLETLHQEIPLRTLDFSVEEANLLKNYQPLSYKPLLVVLNLDDKDVKDSADIMSELTKKINLKNTELSFCFGKIEIELSQLEQDEIEAFMEDYGIKESALNRIIRDSYRLLGLQSYFTVGEDECRAWTIKTGMTAQEAAGVIHSDFYKTFIRAEVVSYKDFMELGSFISCKEKGVWRLEGKEYIVKDGDILSIRHS